MKQDNAESGLGTGGSDAGRLSPAPTLEMKCDSKQKLGGSGGKGPMAETLGQKQPGASEMDEEPRAEIN